MILNRKSQEHLPGVSALGLPRTGHGCQQSGRRWQPLAAWRGGRRDRRKTWL